MKESSAKEEKGIVLSIMDHWNQVFIATKKKKKLGYSKLVLRKQDFGQ